MARLRWKTAGQLLERLNTELPRDPAIALRGTHPGEMQAFAHTEACAQCLQQHYSSQLEGENSPTARPQMNEKQNVVYPRDGVSLGHKK